MSRRGSVRDALAEALERHIAQLTDGRDDAVGDVHWARLGAVVSGMSAVLPGWLCGPVLDVAPDRRAGWYRLRRDELTPVRPAQDCVVRPGERTCRRPHDHWEEVATDAAA